jgi:hypothetical protein
LFCSSQHNIKHTGYPLDLFLSYIAHLSLDQIYDLQETALLKYAQVHEHSWPHPVEIMPKFAQPRQPIRPFNPRSRKPQTAADIEKYRREVLGLPSVVDRWLSRIDSHVLQNRLAGNWFASPTPWSEDPFLGDVVECRVWVTKKEVRARITIQVLPFI